MDREASFRRRLREIVIERFGSIDRFFLETDFSKGHLSQILHGTRSPSLSTLLRLAELLGVEVRDFFTLPEPPAPWIDPGKWSGEKGPRRELRRDEGPKPGYAKFARRVSSGTRRRGPEDVGKRTPTIAEVATDLEVLTWLAEGATNDDLARLLNTSRRAAEYRRRQIVARLKQE